MTYREEFESLREAASRGGEGGKKKIGNHLGRGPGGDTKSGYFWELRNLSVRESQRKSLSAGRAEGGKKKLCNCKFPTGGGETGSQIGKGEKDSVYSYDLDDVGGGELRKGRAIIGSGVGFTGQGGGNRGGAALRRCFPENNRTLLQWSRLAIER